MNQTINISLPKTLADLAKKQVKAGYYSSLSEVIRESLRNHLTSPTIPTYKMSKKAENIALKARKEHTAGKTILLKDVDDLDEL